jgi:isopentenyl phosphate kinase
MSLQPVFVKLGGSLITDKTRPETPRREVIVRLAVELRQALHARPELSIVLGHGSGSFGHWTASRYSTREGVHGRDAWTGFAEVAASATRLSQIVTDLMLQAGVPVLCVRPFPTARCRDGALMAFDTYPIRQALEKDLVPLVHGDVALDDIRGGTIVSTEEIMVYLAEEILPRRILLLGETPGVHWARTSESVIDGEVISTITPANIGMVERSLGTSRGPDVTGGMASKVHQMLRLVQQHTHLSVDIMSGLEPGLLTRTLLDDASSFGTRITADSTSDA